MIPCLLPCCQQLWARLQELLNLADLFTKNVVAGTVKSLLDVLCGYKLVLFEPDKDKSNI